LKFTAQIKQYSSKKNTSFLADKTPVYIYIYAEQDL